MVCFKPTVAATATVLIPALDTLMAVTFSRRLTVAGVGAALLSATVQILVMPYIDAHIIASVAAISIPAAIFCASSPRGLVLSRQQKAGIALILLAIPIGIAARPAKKNHECPHQQAVAACYAAATAAGALMAWGGARNRKLLPAVDGVFGAAATLSAELVANGTYEALLPLATHGCAALGAAAISFRRNPAAYHVPVSYAVWAAGLVITDLAVGHKINLAYALAQTVLSAVGVRLLL